MSSGNFPAHSNDHQSYINDSQQLNQLNVPKLRNSSNTSNAAPATPRMLRNLSNNNPALNDQYTINPEYQQRMPSSRISYTNQHNQRQPSTDRGLLPGVDFNSSYAQTTRVNDMPAPRQQQHIPQSSTHSNNTQQSTTPNRITSANQNKTPVRQQDASIPQSQAHQQQPPNQFHRKAIGDWEFTKTIGAGSMGKVKLAKHRITHEICAIKVVTRASKVWQRQHLHDPPTSDPYELNQRKKDFEKEVARDKRSIREAALGKILYHPFICRLYEMYSMSNHYYMLFEYVSGGQMLDYIVAHGSLKESQARKFCRGIASALDYCHSNNIVHRDLKIENIMINNAGEIKIIDFGLSNLYQNDHLLKTYCGSLYFAAPELLSARPYRGPEVDIWSFGVVLFVLVCGRVPFDDKSVNNLHEKIKKGYIDYPTHLSAECVDLLQRMLVVDVSSRATIDEVINHKWMLRGYNDKVSNYLPERTPLKLPLNEKVINEILNLNLANNKEDLLNNLDSIINSSNYQIAVHNWYTNQQNSESYNPKIVDPTKAYHPLLSIYYLVSEMLERKRIKEMKNLQLQEVQKERLLQEEYQDKISKNQKETITPQIHQNPVFNVTSAQPNMAHKPKNRIVTQPVPQEFQHNTATQGEPISHSHQKPKITFNTNDMEKQSNAAYSLEVPQAAHTSPHSDIPPHSFNQSKTPNLDVIPSPTLQQPTLPQQKQSTPPSSNDESAMNSIFRRLSTKSNKDNDIKRIGSMKVTSKEKQQLQVPSSVSNNANSNLMRKPTHTKQHQRAISAYTGTIFNPTERTQEPDFDTNSTVIPNKQSHFSGLGRSAYHPNARANSVGHGRKHSLNITKTGTYTVDSDAPPLPQFNNKNTETSNTDYDGFFDEEMDTIIFNNDSGMKEKAKLTDREIIEQFENAPANSMPSIEYPKTLFLKGFFNVQTTSTKPLPIIRYDIITILPQLGVQYVEVKGGFICVHYPSIVDITNKRNSISVSKSPSPPHRMNDTMNTRFDAVNKVTASSTKTDTFDESKTPTLSDTSSSSSQYKKSVAAGLENNQLDGDVNKNGEYVEKNTVFTSTPVKTHRRKFSLGNGLLGSRNKHLGGEKLSVTTSLQTPAVEYNIPTTPAPANLMRHSTDESSESLTLDETNGASDMLVSSRLEQQNTHLGKTDDGNYLNVNVSTTDKDKFRSSKTPLKFEIHIVKVPLVGLYGIQFKKVSGNTWLYKSLAGEILSRLNL